MSQAKLMAGAYFEMALPAIVYEVTKCSKIMRIFKNKKLSDRQCAKLNSMLPEGLRRSEWFEKDFGRASKGVSFRLENYVTGLNNMIRKLNEKKKKEEEHLEEVPIKLINIFNTEIFEARPLGMVDVGLVKRFGATSSGDRFDNGAVGYAIEGVFDDVWAKNNAQEAAVNAVKLELLKKAKQIYPDCNLLFKYQVDFREIGSSGNVFIYMRGTAAIGKNHTMLEEQKKVEETIFVIDIEIQKLKEKIQGIMDIRSKIPENLDRGCNLNSV